MPRTRPKKNTGDRKRREGVHRKRLMALGVAEEIVKKMNPKQVRDLLKRPAKVRKSVSAATA